MPDATLVLSRGRCPASALEACHLEGMKSEEIRATSLETLRQMVGVGLGVSLFPRLAAAPETRTARWP
jgi:LysR family hydrogen peroxide-inducible transcriptional activator